MVNLGDLLEVHDADEARFCEVVGKKYDDDGERYYEVYYVHKHPDGYWRYDETFSILAASPAIRYRVINNADYKMAWSHMGFVCVGNGAVTDAMLYHDNPAYQCKTDVITDSSDDETDSESDDLDTEGSLRDFIVHTSDMETDDSESEDSELVAKANHEFDTWRPNTPGERRFKETVDLLEARARSRRSDRRIGK